MVLQFPAILRLKTEAVPEAEIIKQCQPAENKIYVLNDLIIEMFLIRKKPHGCCVPVAVLTCCKHRCLTEKTDVFKNRPETKHSDNLQ